MGKIIRCHLRDLPEDIRRKFYAIGKSNPRENYGPRGTQECKKERNEGVIRLFQELRKKYPEVRGGRRPDGRPGGRKWCWDKIQVKFPGTNVPVVKMIIQNYRKGKRAVAEYAKNRIQK